MNEKEINELIIKLREFIGEDSFWIKHNTILDGATVIRYDGVKVDVVKNNITIRYLIVKTDNSEQARNDMINLLYDKLECERRDSIWYYLKNPQHRLNVEEIFTIYENIVREDERICNLIENCIITDNDLKNYNNFLKHYFEKFNFHTFKEIQDMDSSLVYDEILNVNKEKLLTYLKSKITVKN